MGWFSRLYQCGEMGWYLARTPDDKPFTKQDAYFTFALEIIARELNTMRALEIAKMTAR